MLCLIYYMYISCSQGRIQGGLLGLQPPPSFGKWENMYHLKYECYV